MNIREWILGEVNITIVYGSLDPDSISRDSLRRMLTDVEPPLMTDLPVIGGAIALEYGPLQIQCLIDRRRIRIANIGQASIEMRPLSPMAQIAEKTREIVKAASVGAYGFNYTILAYLEGENDIGSFLRTRFLNDPEDLDNRFGGQIDSVDLRLHYVSDEKEYNLRFQPSGPDREGLQINFNVHFPRELLPTADNLYEQIVAEYAYLRAMADRL